MTSSSELHALNAVQALELLQDGRISAVDLTRACLERIAAREPVVQAWSFLDPAHALRQAEARDAERKAGKPLGPLHGLPVGIKDIIDTADMPTENGTVLHAGRRPMQDAAVVARLRAAGAVIMGKTVTTELAVYHPGKTRNPVDPLRSPGGSSSGSAAAVADLMVPLAVGSQTNGSVIRPAAYCGCYGFKPTFGTIPRTGALVQSPPLDHIGLFARSLDDLALLAEVLTGFDPGDPDTRPTAKPPLLETLRQDWPIPPDLAFVKTPAWSLAADDLGLAFAELVNALGSRVAEVELPETFEAAVETHRVVMESDIAVSFAPEYERGRDRLSARLRGIIESGQRHSAGSYIRARQRVPQLRAALEPLFRRFDAILTPATTGEAPLLAEGHTGSPVFCTIWTLLGLPALSLPLLTGTNGLPMGVQLVGRMGDDARLLRTARWLVQHVANTES